MPGEYPVILDVRRCRIVIVGGGAVGARKATGLLAAGATQVVVVSPTFHPSVPTRVERMAEPFEATHLDGARLVFAATDSPAVNAAVVQAARERNLFVSRADAEAGDEDAGDLAGMATHRDGAITLAVSAAGNPAIAKRVRDELVTLLPSRWVRLATLAATWRHRILRSSAPAAARTAALRSLADPASATLLDEQGEVALQSTIESRLGSVLGEVADPS